MHGLVGLAEVACARGDDERGLRLVGSATAIQDDISAPDHAWQQQVDSVTALATGRLGHARAQAARSAGRRMTIAHAVHYALDGVREAESPLSLRQLEISRSVAKGQTDRQIARELGVSTRTINTYLEEIRTVLGLRSRAELAAWITRYDHP
ncbi:helix-turn-helix transcriptional regulator [Lentzea tibetensis]|uniref:helix-turn-helix transcriptional regulator n=1 Tax=Lentzea tibetensis TaxID=2591470 RepID=UPI001645412B|nr:helix-turn-helix transcriptional regulator [Lentzea tibetensis]